MISKLMNMAVAFTALALAGGHQHVFGINGNPVLCVPDSDMDPALVRYADESTDLHPGPGRIPSFSFLFSSRFMQSIISGYSIVPGFREHAYVNTLSGTVGFLGWDDRLRFGPAMRARNLEEEWYARDECPEPTVTPIPDTGLYEVRCRAGANYSAIWNRAPDPKVSMPKPNEFIVATCQYEHISFGPYADHNLSTCARIVIIEGFRVDYRFQQKNVEFVPQIDSLIRSKLFEWERNCST